MHLKKENVFKFLIFTVAIAIFFTPLSATISVFAEENEQTVTDDSSLPSGANLTSDDETPALDDTTLLDQGATLPPIQVFANAPVDGGGSKYKLISRKVVSLGKVNTLYEYAFAAVGGIGAWKITKSAISAAVVAMANKKGLDYKGYKYLRQSIYGLKTKKTEEYKIVDEYSNSKKTWKGYVTTTFSTVKR